jgi:hypothetical protein
MSGFDPTLNSQISAAIVQEQETFMLWQQKVAGKNISSKTLLATDYLNHFNEIVMLMEMVPDMPEMLSECLGWAPKDYQQHFADSGFSEKDLAIAAYDVVPVKFKKPFEETIQQINHTVLRALALMCEAQEKEDHERLRQRTMTAVRLIQELIATANGIIHGAEHAMDQQEIDTLLA